MDRRRLRVAVIFGGRSGEHEVSLMSAASVMAAMDPERYEVVPVAITREGAWLLPEDAAGFLKEGIDPSRGWRVGLLADPQVRGLIPLPPGAGGTEAPAPAGTPAGTQPSAPAVLREIDVVFPVLHGTYGEDGTIQGLLELANVPYVGPGVLSSAVSMDKVVMKDLFTRHGLPVTPYRGYRVHRWRREPEAVLDEIEEAFGWPVFVKPANLGSSVGVHKCRDRAALKAGLDDAFRYDRKVIVEKAVPEAREIEVSVLGNEDPQASVPGEVVPSREFYDYRAKYLDDASQLLIPAPLTGEQAEEIRRLALAAYRAVDAEGMARVDFLLSRTTGQVFVNEVNTIPGFTPISMYPKLWEASGLPYAELIDRLIQLAIQRWQEKQALVTSYDPDAAAEGGGAGE